MSFDLYINWKWFIYKSKTIYIFIVNDLYINRYLLFQKSCFYLKNLLFLPFWLRNRLPFRCLFGIIPNSSSLLKTFLVRIFQSVNDRNSQGRKWKRSCRSNSASGYLNAGKIAQESLQFDGFFDKISTFVILKTLCHRPTDRTLR